MQYGDFGQNGHDEGDNDDVGLILQENAGHETYDDSNNKESEICHAYCELIRLEILRSVWTCIINANNERRSQERLYIKALFQHWISFTHTCRDPVTVMTTPSILHA